MLERGANLFIAEASSINSKSALEVALSEYQYNKRIFNMICEHLTNTKKINDTDHNGFAAIHYAAKTKNFETLRLLLNSGADICTKDANNQSVLDYSRENEDIELKNIIDEHLEFIGLQAGLRF